jgi:cell division protein FtsL
MTMSWPMWPILLVLGVPVWLCAVGIVTVVFQNRRLRTRPGNVPIRVRPGARPL